MNNKQKAAEFMGEEVISLMKSVLAKHDLAILEESHRMIQEAVAAERERCAKVCDEFYYSLIAQKCAEAIRKGEKESSTGAKPVPEFELIEKWEGE
jgi:hypothetical protein